MTRVPSAVLMILLSCAVTARAQQPRHVVVDCQDAGNLIEVVARSSSPDSPAVVFNCPPGTVIRIPVDAVVRIDGPVVIDGENKVTIEAFGPRHPVFTTTGGSASLTLRNITIRGAQRAENVTVSVISALGPLVLDHVTIEGSAFPISATSDLTVRNSRFTGNTGTVILIGVEGRGGEPVLIENSQFIGNSGPAVSSGATTTVRASQFVGNESGVTLTGGAITASLFQANKVAGVIMAAFQDTQLHGNTFDNNGTGLLGTLPAFMITKARVAVARNLFSGQTAGAIVIGELGTSAPPPDAHIVLDMRHNRFLRNRSQEDGAGIAVKLGALAPRLSMQSRGNVFHDNSAKGSGGAIFWTGGPIAISHSVFRANRAATGGAIFARPSEGAAVSIANTLIVETGGAAIDVPAATILNTTIARNQGRGVVFADRAATALVANTIFDQNAGGNCAGMEARVLQRGNLQFGATDCPGVPVMNPNLDSLYVPAIGSAAAQAGIGAICGAAPVGGVDLLFQRRSIARCSSGAYERPPVRIAAQQSRLVRTCPDGTRVHAGQPCAEQTKTCIGGQVILAGAVCPCQPYGHMCSANGQCCNGTPCVGGMCQWP